jgi:hypothetical protein
MNGLRYSGSNRNLRFLMLGIAMAGSVLSAVVEGPWAVGGAIAAIVAAIVVILSGVYEFVIQPACRHCRLRHPCKAVFVISAQKKRSVKYVVQDTHEHLVTELTLPSNSEVEIEVEYKSSITFDASEIYFGCDGEMDAKPTIASLVFLFYKKGAPEESPDTHPGFNKIDEYEFYHVARPKKIAKNEDYLSGFKMRTRKSGLYRLRIYFVGETVGQPKNDLLIRVEDEPTTKMRCISHRKYRWTKCFIQPSGHA